MDISNKYNIVVGTTRGAVQQTFCKKDEPNTFSIPKEQSEVTALSWGRTEDEVVVGYKSGACEFYDIYNKKYTKWFRDSESQSPVAGICRVVENQAFFVGHRDGAIFGCGPKATVSLQKALDQGSTLDCMVGAPNSDTLVAVGGEKNDVKIIDVESGKFVFKAKSMGHDELNLPIPTSVRGITFLPNNEFLVASATKEGNVLLYDYRAQRRPVVRFFEPKASYTCLTSAFRDKQCIVGTTRGYMQLIDLKNPAKCLKTFTTFTGSVTSIVCSTDSERSVVASTSLDRFLRVHDVATKDLLYKSYLKQSLTKILIRTVVKSEKEEDEEVPTTEGVASQERGVVEDVDEEYEEMFQQMETVSEDKLKEVDKKKRRSEGVKKDKKRKKVV